MQASLMPIGNIKVNDCDIDKGSIGTCDEVITFSIVGVRVIWIEWRGEEPACICVVSATVTVDFEICKYTQYALYETLLF